MGRASAMAETGDGEEEKGEAGTGRNDRCAGEAPWGHGGPMVWFKGKERVGTTRILGMDGGSAPAMGSDGAALERRRGVRESVWGG